MSLKTIFQQADKLIVRNLRAELAAQGHTLTGRLEASIKGEVVNRFGDAHLEGTALYYSKILHHGFGPEKASFKQFPFLVRYFQQRGYPEKEAKNFAAATIKKWQKEGMSTEASKRFSKTGQRQGFIEAVEKAVTPEVNKIISAGIDREVNKIYNRTKSETV